METSIYKHAKHLRAHTWRDIGGVGGILLDFAFFCFLIVMAFVVTVAGIIIVIFDYLLYPFFLLLGIFRGTKKVNSEEPIVPIIGSALPPLHRPVDPTDLPKSKL